jgi:hypothetical protein
MSDHTETKLTPQEQKTARLTQRFDYHIQLWWPKYNDKGIYAREYNFIVDDHPHELWRCDFTKVEADETTAPEEGLWFLWNGKEVTSYDEVDRAFVDFINEKKEARIKSKLQYITSPLAISAVLALLLGLLICWLMIWRNDVPNQLWTIFTAVIAFYFGRKDTRASSAD